MGKSEPKVGILGGTFDPPHLAHLRIAEEALEAFSLNEVWFCPAFDPPHRKEKPKADFEKRLHMTSLAVENNPAFKVIDIERGESPSYTIITLQKLKKLFPQVNFYLIIGWDSFLELSSWYRYQELIDYAELIVCTRGNMDKAEAEAIFSKKVEAYWGSLKKDRVHFLFVFPFEISSSAIRKLRANGKSIRYLVPEGVYAYILEKGIYLPCEAR
ncbi:MAG: nicotinate (nicotinamide) nucleotide adenylyltransferase [Caldimicrobium sp.]|nr:nicotinate (nicotinamide) nucleotide adenylyltransferase [Caldimicrobium sp.]